VTSISNLGECKVCLVGFCPRLEKLRCADRTRPCSRPCRGALYATARPCAITFGTYTSYLCSHSRAFYVSFTLHVISENNLSYVMYIVYLRPASSLLTYLAGITRTKPRAILRRSSAARAS
jgi:hypothetical protein